MQKKIVILGAAESGVGAAILARRQGFDVFVSDAGKIKEHYKTELDDHQIQYEEVLIPDSLLHPEEQHHILKPEYLQRHRQTVCLQ